MKKMKKIMLLFVVVLCGATSMAGQVRYPNAVAGPEGIYVNCGNRIPRDFAYQVFRRAKGGKTWDEMATIACENHFDAFFNKVVLANVHNPVYQLPTDEKKKGMIWQLVQQASFADSIPLFGTLPMYREALGVTWYDGTAEKGQKYEYKVVTLQAGRQPEEKVTATVSYPLTPRSDYAIKVGKHEVKGDRIDLSFTIGNKQDMYAAKLMRGYYLQSDLVPLSIRVGFRSENDVSTAIVTDTAAVRRGLVLYCLQPYDIYGNPGRPSDTIRITNLTDLDETNYAGLNAHPDKEGIRLTWHFPKPEFLRSIDIYKATGFRDSLDYRYLLSVSPSDTSYLDKDVIPSEIYSYKVVVNNAYGESPLSMSAMGWYYGDKPATAPVDLRAEVSMGAVKLMWSRPDGDTKAYYIMRSVEGDTALQQVGAAILSDSLLVTYTDSVNDVNCTMLTYAVRSENASRNLSPLSERIYVTPMRNIRLPAPLNLTTHYADKRVWVSWDMAEEFDRNVMGYRLERRIAPTNKADTSQHFKPVRTNKMLMNYYEDADVKEGLTYEYRLFSIGAHGLESSPSVVSSCLVPVVKPLSISSLQVQKTNGGYRLAWEETEQENIDCYKVYRVQENQPPRLLAKMKKNETSYFDSVKEDKVIYLYTVTCTGTNGVESEVIQWMGAN